MSLTDTRMLRRIHGVTKDNRIRNDYLQESIGSIAKYCIN